MLLTFKGRWNAVNNTATLVDGGIVNNALTDGVGTIGDCYIIYADTSAVHANIYDRNLGSGTKSWIALNYIFYGGAVWAMVGGTEGTGTVTQVDTAAPLSGGPITTTGIVSIPKADSSTDGYLSSIDWQTFNNKSTGTVTSVGLSMPSAFNVSPSGITTSGIFAVSGAGTAAQYIRGNGTLASFPTISSSGITSINNLITAAQFLVSGTTGINFNISSSGSTHTFNLPIATSGSTGKLTSTDWTTFNNKLTNPMTTAGDMIYQSSGSTAVRLPIGAINTALIRSAGGLPIWSLIDLSSGTTGVLTITNGGTGNTSLITTPTASTIVGQDANSNYSANAFIPNYQTVVTSGGTTTLTASSPQLNYFTGTATHSVVLPVTSTLTLGRTFTIASSSTSNVTIKASGGATVAVLMGPTQGNVVCIGTSTALTTDWDATSFNVMHATGNETIAGTKTLSNTLLVTGAGTSTIGSSTSTSTLGLGTGSTISGATKTVNIGINGALGSTVAINIGTGVTSGSTETIAIGTAGISTNTVNGITTFNTGIGQGSGLKHQRVTTGSIAAGASSLVTLTWSVTFADANYTVNASVVDSTAAVASLHVIHIETVSASTVTVRVENTSAGSLTGTLHVIALHD